MSKRSTGEEVQVEIETVDEPCEVRIEDTYGKRLVLKGALPGDDPETYSLTRQQFERVAWEQRRQCEADPTVSEECWKRQIGHWYFRPRRWEDLCSRLSLKRFQARTYDLLDEASDAVVLAKELGISKQTFWHDTIDAWAKMVTTDVWCSRRFFTKEHVGFISCPAIQIGGNAQVEFRGISLHAYRDTALFVRGNTKVRLENCDISGACNGVNFGDNASGELLASVIRDCGKSGLVIANTSGSCVIRHSQIQQNGYRGVVIYGEKVQGNACHFEQTSVTDNATFGLAVVQGAAATWYGPASTDGNPDGPVKLETGGVLQMTE